MRFSIMLLFCLMLFACGNTGALYLPEEPTTQPEQNTQSPSEQPQSPDTSNGGKAD